MTRDLYNDIDEEEFLTEVENLGGPRFRRMEERANGRDLMTWKGTLAHTDIDVSPDNLTAMAAALIEERVGWIRFLEEEEERGAEDFIAYYMDE